MDFKNSQFKIIYKPGGRAQEYAESSKGADDGLAANLYKGCRHNCAFCYVPTLPTWKFVPGNPRVAFHEKVLARGDVLAGLESDARKLAGQFQGRPIDNPLHLCFTCDPYPITDNEDFVDVTRDALLTFERFGFSNVQVLTKGGERAVRDFDILSRNGWKFGQTIVFRSPDAYARYEPGAAGFDSRLAALRFAKDAGLKTWVSIEPVIDPVEALLVIDEIKPYVDIWKIGKLNHGKEISPALAEIEASVDWRQFAGLAKQQLIGREVLFKDSLAKYL